MHTDKNWLFVEFVEKNRSAGDIGNECGVTDVTVRWWARKFGFRRRRWGSKRLNEFFFDKITTERQAYWLGFLAADGSVQNKPGKRLLSVVLANKDRNHLELFREHIDSEHNIYYYERDHDCNGYQFHSESAHFDLPSSRLVEGLMKQGIMPGKTKTLRSPKLLTRLVRHWTRGYFDGDGSVSKLNGSLKVTIVGTEEVMSFIRDNAPGFKSPIERKRLWYIALHGNTKGRDFGKYLYNRSTVYLERKKNIFERK